MYVGPFLLRAISINCKTLDWYMAYFSVYFGSTISDSNRFYSLIIFLYELNITNIFFCRTSSFASSLDELQLMREGGGLVDVVIIVFESILKLHFIGMKNPKCIQWANGGNWLVRSVYELRLKETLLINKPHSVHYIKYAWKKQTDCTPVRNKCIENRQ